MREYGFSVTCVLPYNDTIYDFVLIRENTGHWKPVFLHILCSELSSNFFFWLFLKPRIQEQGTECGECEERGECSLWFREISWRVPGNALILRFRGMFKKMKRKEIARAWENTKKEKLKTKTNISRKWIKEIIVILYSCWK